MTRAPRCRAAPRLILALLACLLAAPSAFGFGRREDPLLEVDRLIAEQRYNDAILVATEFIKKYPNRFDEAQKKLQKIIKIRESYNRITREFLDLLVNPSGDALADEEKKLALIALLEDMIRDPRPSTTKFIRETKATALASTNQLKREDILARARALIDGKRFVEAAAVYEEGYALYRPEFDTGPVDEITKRGVAGMVESARAGIATFRADSAAVDARARALAQAFEAGQPAQAETAWLPAREALVALAELRNRLLGLGRSLDRQYRVLEQAGTEAIFSNFPAYAAIFTQGRQNALLQEGVVGAMNSQWIELLNGIQTALDNRLDADYVLAEAELAGGDYEAAALAFEGVAALAAPGLEALGLWSLLGPTDLVPVPSAYGRAILTAKAAGWNRVAHLQKLALAHARLARLEAAALALEKDQAARMAALDAAPPPSGAALTAALEALAAARREVAALSAAIEGERLGSRAYAEDLARWTGAALGDERSTRAQGAYDGRLAAALEATRGYEVASAARSAGLELRSLAAGLEARRAALARSLTLMEGTEPDPVYVLLRYPGQAAGLLAAEEAGLAGLRSSLAALLARLQRELPFVAGSAPVQALLESTRNLDRGVAESQAERLRLLGRAQDQKRQADAARNEAERRLAEAQAALRGEDFELAQERLERVSERYTASLSLEYDPALKARGEAAIAELGARIAAAWKAKVNRDVRALITEGKALYYQGSFDRAETDLVRARTIREPVYGTVKDPEVEYWLGLVQSAISIKTGRDIPSSSPLYNEMNQLLTLATKYYEDGKRMLEQRRKTDAIQSFKLAKEKITEVRVVFPLSEKAGELDLRVDQLADPDAFRLSFAAKFGELRRRIEAEPRNREAYAALLDLAKIDPRYPGLRALIDRAEIANGIKEPPPDPAKIRRAAELVAAARRIVDSGDRNRYDIALDQLNEAIVLDPNSQAAIVLKDRVLNQQGGSTQLILSAAAEAQYAQAVALYQEGQYLQAYGIVERLLQDARNRTSSKLNDLKLKIEGRL